MAKRPRRRTDSLPRIRRIDSVTVEAVWGETRHAPAGHELIHVRGGAARIEIGRKSYDVGPGDVIVVPNGALHRDVRLSEDEYHVLYVWFTGDEDLVERIDARVLSGLPARSRSHVQLMIAELEDEYAAARDADDERLRLALHGMLVALARYSTPRKAAKPKRGPIRRAAAHEKLAHAAQGYIDAHFAEETTLESAARALEASQFHLSRVFSEVNGLSFTDALTLKRIDRARELLKSGDAPVKEVAARVGYANGNYFAKVFRRVTGCSPTEYAARG